LAIERHIASRAWSADFLSQCQLLSLRATQALEQGHPARAATQLATFLDQVGELDPNGDASLARAQLGLALAWSNASAEVPASLPPLTAAGRWRLTRIELLRCESLASIGRLDDARAAAVNVADRALGEGRMQVAADALHLAGRIRADISVLKELTKVASLCSSTAPALAVRHLRALVDGDSEELVELALEFERRRYLALAVEAATDAGLTSRRRDVSAASQLIVDRLSSDGVQPLIVRRFAESADQLGKRFDHSGLTDRERKVAELVARGASNREIGSLLGISSRTAETHLQSAYRKLGVSNRDALLQRFGS
jgi:DNA-binding CsgD family transcriptional regulator